jgi:hypothetical protein
MGRERNPSWLDSRKRPRDVIVGLDGSPRVATVHGTNGWIYIDLFTWLEG